MYDDYKIKSLHITVPKTSAYAKSYDGQIKWMYFLILILKKEFDSEPVYNNKFLKTKIKSYGDEATDFHNKGMSKAGSNHTCLAVITIGYIALITTGYIAYQKCLL